MRDDLLALAADLARRQVPFALATVVRCERPTSAKPGAKALIREDGTLTGWVGGSCAEPVVVKEALGALQDGEPRLLALVGEGAASLGAREGVREHAMPCHSGGSLEIYVEPVLPKPGLVLIGRGPVVETLATLASSLNFAVAPLEREASLIEDLSHLAVTPETAIVVATHGRFDEDALVEALRTEARYVSLVASPKRAEAVAATLRARGVPADALQRLKAPAGLDLGAVTPEEIAVSILAEIIRVRRAAGPRPSAAPHATHRVAEAHDPVCGMAVQVASARHVSEVGGERFYFCCAGCKQRFDGDPTRYGAEPRA